MSAGPLVPYHSLRSRLVSARLSESSEPGAVRAQLVRSAVASRNVGFGESLTAVSY